MAVLHIAESIDDFGLESDFNRPTPQQAVSLSVIYAGSTGRAALFVISHEAPSGSGREEITGYLIDKGADLNFINAEGRSVLGIARVHGHLKALERICSKEDGHISRAVYGRFFEKLSMNHLTPDQIKVLQLCGSKTL